MRNRAWRRHMEEIKVIYRLKNITHSSRFSYEDVNYNLRPFTSVKDYIGLHKAFKFKTYTTSSQDSKFKCKYSPNKGGRYWRNGIDCRERQKIEFLKILKENGVK